MKPKHALPLVLLLALVFTGCGGGGTNDPTAQSGTGTVALTLTDSPTDAYDQMNITIRRVLLLRDGQQVVAYNPAEPQTFNLLDLRSEGEEDAGALLAVLDVPAGTYDKIRVEVAANADGDYVVEGVIDEARVDIFRIPGTTGHIDFNPRGPFTVAAGGALAITLDIDCEKSIHISGNAKNFRPVVFVDIDTEYSTRCPRILEGQITGLTYGEDEETVTGFELTLTGSAIRIPVKVDGGTVVFDNEGSVATVQALQERDRVTVRARLQEGGLTATLVVVGEVTLLEGTVTQAVVADRFTLDDEDEIEVLDQTLILWGCFATVEPASIQPGMRARVFAKQQDGFYRAIAVVLNHQIAGQLTAVEVGDDGALLEITPAGEGGSIDIVLPATAPIQVKFDGFVSISELKQLVDCSPRSVLINLNASDGVLTAARVVVIPEPLEATILSVDPDLRRLETDAGVVEVAATARIVDVDYAPPRAPAASFGDLNVGDRVILYGFALCSTTPSFEAVVVIVTDQND